MRVSFFYHKYSNQLGFWALKYLIMKIQGHLWGPLKCGGPGQLPTSPMLKSAPGRGASSAVSVNCLRFIGRSRCYRRRSPQVMTGFESLILSNKSFWVCRLLFFLTCHLYIFEALSGTDLRNHHTEVIFRA